MITKYGFAVFLSLAVFQGAAFADTLTGTITSIDPSSGRVTLRQAGSSQTVDVTVRDRSSLSSLRNGSAVSLDANKGTGGSWEASTIEAGSLSSNMTGSSAAGTAGTTGASGMTGTSGSLSGSSSGSSMSPGAPSGSSMGSTGTSGSGSSMSGSAGSGASGASGASGLGSSGSSSGGGQ
jgi:hypothetical protein